MSSSCLSPQASCEDLFWLLLQQQQQQQQHLRRSNHVEDMGLLPAGAAVFSAAVNGNHGQLNRMTQALLRQIKKNKQQHLS